MNWPESRVPETAWTSMAFPRGPQSLEESTTMGSVLGSISASIMEIFRMSDTEGLSPEGPELDSGISLAVASPLLKTGDEWWELPKLILVTVALCVMIGWLEGVFSVLTGWCACSGGGWDIEVCRGLWWDVGACWSLGSCGVTRGLVGVPGVESFTTVWAGTVRVLSLGLWVKVWGLD